MSRHMLHGASHARRVRLACGPGAGAARTAAGLYSVARSSRHSFGIVQRVFMINYVRKLLDRPQRRVADVGEAAGSTYEAPPAACPSNVSLQSLSCQQPCRTAPVPAPPPPSPLGAARTLAALRCS